ncbi:MAG: APC family permease [Pseudomonadota bacterium]|nr:APC family permease [Pseudomonadota bacterium]
MAGALKKEINSLGLLFTSLSCMIGSGWLLSSIVAAKIAGPAAILSWFIGGILIGFIAISFSELSTAFPVAGGIARYGQFSHGSGVSFIISWLAWLSCVAVAPTEAQAMLQYASRFFEGLTYKSGGTILLTHFGIVCAIIIVFILSWINIQGIKTMIKYNNILTIWKISVPLLVLILLSFGRFEVKNFTSQSFMPYGIEGVLSALSTTVIFSYLGFRECTSLAAEVKNPQKAIPIACIGSVAYCMVFYMFMQSVFIGAITDDMLTAGWSNLSFDFDAGPFAGLAIALGMHWLATLIYIDSVIAPSGAGLVYTATTSRLLLAMSENGFLPKFFADLNKMGVPKNAVVVNAVVGITLLAPFEDWVALVKFQSVAIVLAYAVGPVALLSLRKIIPNHPRPFKLPAANLFSHITLFICMMLVYWSGWDTVYALIISVIIGLGIYLLKLGTKELKHSAWLAPLLLVIGIVSYLGNYGGIGVLSPLQDTLIILGASSISLVFGVKSRLSESLSHFYLNDTSQQYYDAI